MAQQKNFNNSVPDYKQLKQRKPWKCKCKWWNDKRSIRCEQCNSLAPSIQRDFMSSLPHAPPQIGSSLTHPMVHHQSVQKVSSSQIQHVPNIGSIYGINTNAAHTHSYTSSNQANVYKPNHANLNPPMISKPSTFHDIVTLPTLNPHTNETYANLHPSILNSLSGTSQQFTQSVKLVEKDNNKSIEYDSHNILGCMDWLEIKVDSQLNNFGKSFGDACRDRLYYGLQRFLLECPKGPFQGTGFWNKIAEYTNSTRTGSSYKTQFNKITADENKGKGTHRWSQLNALKMVIGKKRQAKSVKNGPGALTAWKESELIKKKVKEQQKEASKKKKETQDMKLSKLLDLAIIREVNAEDKQQLEQLKLKHCNYEQIEQKQNLNEVKPYYQNEIKQQELNQMKQQHFNKMQTYENGTSQQEDIDMNNKFDVVRGKYNKKHKQLLLDLKDDVDEIEEDENFKEAEVDDFKQVLFLGGHEDERAAIMEEYERLKDKYYSPAKVVKKLLKVHSYFKKNKK